MIAYVDGDVCLYRIGFVTENETEESAISSLDLYLDEILTEVNAKEYKIFLSCSREDNFRLKYNHEYKANRPERKPTHFKALKQHLLDKHNALVGVTEEADDLIGIAQYKDPDGSIGVTNDKDILYGVVGHKYNCVTKNFNYNSPEEATKYFYRQLLMGDRTDNIDGIYGLGKAKSLKIVEHLETEEDLFLEVQNQYRMWLAKEWKIPDIQNWTNFNEKQMNNIILMNGIQLKIREHEGQVWHFPIDVSQEVNPVLD